MMNEDKVSERKIADVAKLILTAIIVLVVLCIAAFWVLRTDVERCYDMPPNKFIDQTKFLRVGMMESEALMVVKGYTDVRRDKDSIFLVMSPKRSPRILIAIPIWIKLSFSSDGKLKSITTGDG